MTDDSNDKHSKTLECQKLEKNCPEYLSCVYLTMFLWFNSFNRQISRSAELGTPCRRHQPSQH